MLFMPLPFMRGFGIGGLVIPLVSVACALTLLPVLVYFCVNGLDRVRIVPKRVLVQQGLGVQLLVASLPRGHAARAGGGRRDDGVSAPPRTAGSVAGGRAGLEQGDPTESRRRRGSERDLGRRRRGRPRPDGDRRGHRPRRRRRLDRRARRDRRARAGSPRRSGGGGGAIRRGAAVRRSERPLLPHGRDRDERVRLAAGPPLRRPPARRDRPVGALPGGRERLSRAEARRAESTSSTSLTEPSRGSSSACCC